MILKFIRRIAFLLLMGASLSPLMAQNGGVLSGTVCDAEGNPLDGASVAAVNLNPVQGVRTDRKGYFKINLPVDSLLKISIRYSGFATIDTLMRLSGSNQTVLFVRMQKSATQLGTVTVSDKRSRTTTFTTIDVERVERSAAPQVGVESMLKMLPDVASNNELSSQYSVRGGSFDENLVYINDVEVYRPQLVRNGQQEGSSIINPDLVDYIRFSPGGFDATYGDRMASVLDITYGRPNKFRGKAMLSFLDASLSLEGTAGSRLAYSMGMRHHSNRYLMNSLDTKGNYTTSYSDIQALVSYTVSESVDLQALAILSRNRYGLIPESQTTTFGGFSEAMEFSVFYEGEEADLYRTALGALTMDYHPNDDFRLRWTTAVQGNNEAELYDILSQFWLYELNVGNINENGETEKFERGVGSFLEHARNYLQTNIVSSELRGTHYARLGNWNWGFKVQHEQVRDRMKEWKWVDSAGYAMPMVYVMPGVDSNMAQTPMLQFFCRADHRVATTRLSAFLQRNVDLYNDRGDLFSFVAGARMQWYNIDFGDDASSTLQSSYGLEHLSDTASEYNRQLLFSPRISFNYKPAWRYNMLFRIAAGVYSQAPFYREYRYDDGALNHALKAQQSYQAMATFDWDMHIGRSPFKFTADVYYKYIDHLVPYRIENLRIRYDAENDAVGYATGISLRFSGEVVEGLESWASLSLMKTQQDILGDDVGWIDRPADQRVSFKLFFQDYVPTVPFWRMSVNLIVGSGMPFTFPQQTDLSATHRYPAYFRADWGNTIQLSHIPRIKESRLMRYIDDLLFSFEIFNLFDYKNVVSYTCVSDYNNQYYPVPNYLTARQLNLKLTVIF